MKKDLFIEKLKKKLKENNVNDIEEIISEYEEHYMYKFEDGYSEEEISKKLGNPLFLANQYIETEVPLESNKKIIAILGLVVSDFFMFSFYVTFIAWIIILFVFSIASLSIGFSLFINLSPYGWIPYLPYWCGAVLGVSFVSLALLSFIGTYYNYLYLKQISKSYVRFHNNTIAASKNKPTLPSLPSHPILSKKVSRKLRTSFLLFLNAFAISIVLGYLVCALTAKSLEFWHVFEWFV